MVRVVDINNIEIREIKVEEEILLKDLLYEAIYQPDITAPIPREVINLPEIQVYIQDYGTKKDDYCLVADLNGQIVGGVWIRVLADEIKGYGNIDDTTPELAISVYAEYRNQGIGILLMKKMISYLRLNAYSQVSLSVQKENYAVKMYKNLGFKIIDENDEDYLMLLKL